MSSRIPDSPNEVGPQPKMPAAPVLLGAVGRTASVASDGVIALSEKLGEASSTFVNNILKLAAATVQMVRFCIFIVLVFIVITSISECTSRFSFSASIQEYARKINLEMANSASRGTERALDYEGIKGRISAIEEATKILERSGTPNWHNSLDKLQSIFRSYLENRDPPPYLDLGTNPSSIRIFYVQINHLIQYQPTDILLALISIASGALGAQVAGYRRVIIPVATNNNTNVIIPFVTSSNIIGKDFILGMATGFIVYIGIRGGKQIFIMQVGDVNLNPYGFGTAGLICGLFSERVYDFINTFVAKIHDKLNKALN